MSNGSWDTVVIGSGCAGFSAALALKKRGLNVAVLSANGGASSVASGAWDFGPIPNQGSFVFDELRASRLWQNLYRKLLVDEKDSAPASELKASALEVAEALNPRLKIDFDFKRGYCLPTSSGLWKSTFGAQRLQVGADLKSLKGKRVGLVTSDHFRFRADLIAKAWVEQAAKRGEILDISPLWIHWNIPNGDWPLPHLAARLEHDPLFRQSFRSAIGERLEGSHYDLLIFPPLFLDPSFADELSREFHCPVAECLATTEPIPGYRLTTAIAKTLQHLEISNQVATQLQAEASDGLARGLKYYSSSGSGWQEVKAQSYVLATGKLFGGGIKLGFDRIEESVFQLPLFTQRAQIEISRRSDLPWKQNNFRDEQAWAKLGVWLDGNYRPMDKSNQPVLRNLTACGSLIGGLDFSRSGLGMGFMAYSGRQSGKQI